MKKSKFIMGLSAAFISAVALMSCSGFIRAKDGVVLTIDGVPYTAEELYGDQKTPAAAEAKFNAVYRVAIRHFYQNDQQGKDDMADITNDTKIEINRQKVTAQENADKNGTSYDEEWKKILDSNNVETEDELYSKFEYDKQKAKFEDRLYENNYDVLREGGQLKNKNGDKYGSNIDGYLKEKQPYHVKHILVKIAGAKGSDDTGVTISADEADKLSTVIKELAGNDGQDNLTFGEIAHDKSDDEGSAKNYGDLGIMDRDTSFVNEFKLGTYLYESFFGYEEQSTRGNAKKALGLDDSSATKKAANAANIVATINDPTTTDNPNLDTGRGIGQIPFEVALLLGKNDWSYGTDSGVVRGMGLANIDYKSQHFSETGDDSVTDVAKYYPRNVLFNKYFNKHNIMVITPRRTSIAYKSDAGAGATEPFIDKKDDTNLTNLKNNLKANYFNTQSGEKITKREAIDKSKGIINATFANLPGFKKSAKNNDEIDALPDDNATPSSDDTILRDENGRVIFVFRSGTGGNSSNDDSGYFGIHFVVVERSPFIDTEQDYIADTDSTTNIKEYYTEYFKDQIGGKHPTYESGSHVGQYKRTYTNYFSKDELAKQKERADTVKSKLKACDPNLNTYIYEYLTDEKRGEGIKFADGEGKKVKEQIENWIEINKRGASITDKNNSWDDTWTDYMYSIQEAMDERHTWTIEGGVDSNVASESAAILYAVLNGKEDAAEVIKYFSQGGVFHE